MRFPIHNTLDDSNIPDSIDTATAFDYVVIKSAASTATTAGNNDANNARTDDKDSIANVEDYNSKIMHFNPD